MLRWMWRICALALLLIYIAFWISSPTIAQEVRGPIYAVEVQGPITSVVVDYLRSALQRAQSADATALLITVNSTGGVLRDIRPFAGEIAQAKVPVVVYIAPAGTNSGAVGTFLLSAAQISALAPGTSFGTQAPLTQVDTALTQQTRDLVLDSVASQLRDWNAAQGRNTQWIDRAVREGVILNNEQATALQPQAVDLVAANQDQLLTLLDGRTVKIAGKGTLRLATLGRTVTPIEPSLWQSLRLTLANPTIAFVLLIMGALAIYLELSAPGTTIFAGIGIVLLAGAAIGFIALPIQLWGLLLVVFSLALIGAEFFVSSHGGLMVTGLVLLVVGALNLIDPTQAPGVSVAVWAIAAIVLVLGSFAALGVWLALRSRTQPVTTGQEGLIGRVAEVRTRLDPEGMVFVEGALWRAINESEDDPAEVGDLVRVAAMHDLRLIVRRIESERDT